MFSFGKDKQTARVAGEFYVNAINVMRGAEGLSTYAPIDEAEKFRIEYWALEEAKLQRMPKPKPLATRIALVTGAASGIGKAIATRLAAEGACVVIADLSLEKAQAAAAELGEHRRRRRRRGRRRPTRRPSSGPWPTALLAFGGLDLVVNNAGLSLSKSLLDTTVADWDLQHNVMAKGSFLVSRAAAKVLIEQGLGGDIVYISSKNSVFAGPNNIAYSATKADQAHQVRLLAAELGEHGVKVNGINPDGVVRGSGIFAGGWGAKRAAVYGVDEEDLGQVLRPAHPAQARGAARARRQRGRSCLLGRTCPTPPACTSRSTPAWPPPSSGEPRVLTVAAVDLGASSGRVDPGPGRPGASCTSRRCTGSRTGRCGPPDGLHWNILGLYDAGAGRAPRGRPARRPSRWPAWHRLLGGRLRAAPAAASCSASRSTTATTARAAGVERVHARVAHAGLYARNGLQFLPFNTLYQLAADTAAPRQADRMLLLPDLLGYWLTGEPVTELTNASTTGLLDVRTRTWDRSLVARARPPGPVPRPLVEPGTTVGHAAARRGSPGRRRRD